MVSATAQKFQNIWATFAIQFVTKKFQKSPNLVTLVRAENTHLLCSADILFDWFGFNQTSKSVANST